MRGLVLVALVLSLVVTAVTAAPRVLRRQKRCASAIGLAITAVKAVVALFGEEPEFPDWFPCVVPAALVEAMLEANPDEAEEEATDEDEDMERVWELYLGEA